MEKEILYQKIYNDLVRGIADGGYPPGSRLPSEKDLSMRYGVSRITSKKALELLADANRIIRIPGRGSYVLDAEVHESTETDPMEQKAILEEKKLIGVVMDRFDPSYGNLLISGIEYECSRYQFSMILKCSYGSVEMETQVLEELVEMGARGIILMCVQEEVYNPKVLQLYLDKFPIVLVDREMQGMPIPCVNTDNYKASRELMEVLMEEGHRNICFLSHQYNQSSVVSARFSGYLDSLFENGLQTSEKLWIKDLHGRLPHYSEEEDEEQTDVTRIRQFILEHPDVTGFFSINHPIGIMVYKILRELRQEKEKTVVFFDGIEEGYDSNPVFSRIVQGEYFMGVKAVKLLRDQIKGHSVPQKNYVPHLLVKKNP